MDLAKLESHYWKELRKAARGDRGPLLAKLRAGDLPTPTDLRGIADLIEGRLRPAKSYSGGQVKNPAKYIQDHEALINASIEYDRRVREAGGSGAIRGQSEAIFRAVAAMFGVSDWRKLRNFHRQSASKHKVRLRP